MADSDVLSLIRLFPCVFTCQSDELVRAASLLELLRFSENTTDKQILTAAWLQQFVQASDCNGKVEMQTCSRSTFDLSLHVHYGSYI